MSSADHIVMTGASGAVGAQALAALLADPRVAAVTCLGRRPLPTSHDKLRALVVDLTDERAVAAAIPDGVDAAVCALGTTMKQAGSKAAFRAVDFDAVVAFAQAARARGARRFALVSSMGADASSSNFYLKTKGQAEGAVCALGYDAVHILRPSILDDAGARAARRDSRPGEQLGLVVMRGLAAVIGPRHRYAPIGVDVVGRAAARLVLDDATSGRHVHLSDALHRIGAG
jgi:uncharacterized protein YbjT (DUF2867 family)